MVRGAARDIVNHVPPPPHTHTHPHTHSHTHPSSLSSPNTLRAHSSSGGIGTATSGLPTPTEMAFSTVRSRQIKICTKWNNEINLGVILVNWTGRFLERVHTKPVPPLLNILITGHFSNSPVLMVTGVRGKGARVTRRDKQRKMREERASRINSRGSSAESRATEENLVLGFAVT